MDGCDETINLGSSKSSSFSSLGALELRSEVDLVKREAEEGDEVEEFGVVGKLRIDFLLSILTGMLEALEFFTSGGGVG